MDNDYLIVRESFALTCSSKELFKKFSNIDMKAPAPKPIL